MIGLARSVVRLSLLESRGSPVNPQYRDVTGPSPHVHRALLPLKSVVVDGKRDTRFKISTQRNLIVHTDGINGLGGALDDHLKFDAHNKPLLNH